MSPQKSYSMGLFLNSTSSYSSSEGTDTDSKVCRQKPTNKKLKKSFQKPLTNGSRCDIIKVQ